MKARSSETEDSYKKDEGYRTKNEGYYTGTKGYYTGTEGYCPKCGKIIYKDIKNYLKKNKNKKWDQCCYCGNHFLIKDLK